MNDALIAATGAVRGATPLPWTLSGFSLHPGAWAGVLILAAVYAAVIRRSRYSVSPRQAWCFLAALGVLLVAYTWPLSDMAARSLLVALVVQRLLVLLAVPPLLFGGLPRPFVASLTRPAALDAIARVCSRPVPAVGIVTLVAVGTLSVPAVDAAASSTVVRGALDLVLVAAGLVLWMPVLHPVPGTPRLSHVGTAGYLVVQSILPGFLSVVWIFARHPLYAPFKHPGHVLGLSSLSDQQLSGFVAKFAVIAVLWTVALVMLLRAEHGADEGGDPDPLTWADVERQLERVERRERRMTEGRDRPR